MGAVMHGLKGRASNRKIAAKTARKARDLIRRQYRDYGPTQAAEVLASEHGLVVSRETVCKWMCAAKLWRAKRARVERVHGWRPRRERRGELVQWDTSEHDWLEGRGPKLYLIAMIEDASSELTPFCAERFDGREHAFVVDIPGTVWPAGGFLHRQSEFVHDQSALA
jgi:hypothetical protein